VNLMRQPANPALFSLTLIVAIVSCFACHGKVEDRTDDVHWFYLWEPPNPVDQITERFRPGTIIDRGRVSGLLAVGPDRTVYAVNAAGLVAMHPSADKWQFKPDDAITTSPAIAEDGTIFFASAKGLAWAVSSQGQKRWTSEVPHVSAGWPSQPAIALDGTTYWPSHGLYALKPDGKLNWIFSTGEDFRGVSVAGDGTVYAVTKNLLYALTPRGEPRWKVVLAEPLAFAPVVGTPSVGSDGTIYVTTGMDLIAVKPEGSVKWRSQGASDASFSGPVLSGPDGTAYARQSYQTATYEGTQIKAFDLNGKVKWTIRDGQQAFGIAADNTLYIGYVYSLAPITPRGKMLWTADLIHPSLHAAEAFHEPVTAVALAPNGQIYIGDHLGRMGTIEVPAGLAESGWPAPLHDARNTARASRH
jgi:outer membrane protein assembly factor BamB